MDLLARTAVALLHPSLLPDWVYWILQLAAIPAVMSLAGIAARERLEARMMMRLGRHDRRELPRLTPAWSPTTVSAVAAMTFLWPAIFMEQLTFASGWSAAAVWLLLTAGFFAYSVYLAQASIDVSGHHVVLRHGDGKLELIPGEAPAADSGDESDENDHRVTHLEAAKTLLERRVDSYILESAFLGALAFSGFVSIMASNNTNAASLTSALSDLRSVIHSSATGQPASGASWPDLIKTDRLLALIALESLISSVAFLVVIIARVRFSALMVPAEYFVALAHRMNQKEDSISESVALDGAVSEAVAVRIQKLRAAIEGIIDQGDYALRQLLPIITYMGLFRAVGVIFFLLALITAALWFDERLAFAFAVTSATAFTYPWIDGILRRSENRQARFSSVEELLAAAANRSRAAVHTPPKQTNPPQ